MRGALVGFGGLSVEAGGREGDADGTTSTCCLFEGILRRVDLLGASFFYNTSMRKFVAPMHTAEL